MSRVMFNIEGLRARLRQYRLNHWIIEAQKHNTDEKLRLSYAGHALNKNYIADLVADGKATEKYMGKVWLWTALRADFGAKYLCDLTVVETEAANFRKYEATTGAFYIPAWVYLELDLGDINETIRRSSSIASDLSKIRRNFKIEFSRDRQHIEYFYHKMYVPYISMVYGKQTALHPLAKILARLDEYELVVVRKDGNDVAGGLIHYEQNGVKLHSLGVLHGNFEYVSMGALAAVYCHVVKHLHSRGYQSMHLGASRAFLSDGVLRYKRKWQPRLIDSTTSGFCLRVRNWSDAVDDFFVRHPYIYCQDRKLHAAIFSAQRELQDAGHKSSLCRRYWIRGLKSLDVFRMDRPEGKLRHLFSETDCD